jgi:hypothetical protein
VGGLEKTMHPQNRAERRHVREVWRNYRRTIIFTTWGRGNHYDLEHAMQNGGWLKGGKQYFACGNRCQGAMLERWSDHLEVKALRREPIEWDEDECLSGGC